MSKQFKITVLIVSIFSFAFTKENDVDLNQLEFSKEFLNFVNNFNTFYPHPEWVMKDMMKMSMDDFVLIFSFITSIVYDKMNRWKYLYDTKQQFLDDFIDAQEFVEHFMKYNNYFKRLAIRIPQQTFKLFDKKLYQDGEFEIKGEVFMPALVYIKNKDTTSFENFYATYFSYLSYCFIETAKKLYNTKDSSLKTKLSGYFTELCDIVVDQLKESSYEGRAFQVLIKYYPIYIDLTK